MNIKPSQLEHIVKQKKTRRFTRHLLAIVASGLMFASLGDYLSINNRLMEHVHVFAGIRDSRFSANPFDYRISYRINDDHERIAYVENTRTGDVHRLYNNGKTEPGSEIIDLLSSRIQEDYEWFKSTAVGQQAHELKERVLSIFSSKEDD